MSTPGNLLLESDVDIATLAQLIKNSGRNILSIESDIIWVEGAGPTNIQVGHVKNKRSICIFAGRPLPDDLTELECALLASKLNTEFDVIRFYSHFSETAKRYVLFIDHYIFYTEALIVSHLLMSLQLVEYFALEYSIKSFHADRRSLN